LHKGEWTFLTNYGRVLAYIAKHPQTTTREIAQEAGITERAIQKIIADLEANGYIARHREGRCNRYTIHPELPMRHPLERDHAVGDLLLALGCNLRKKEIAEINRSQNIAIGIRQVCEDHLRQDHPEAKRTTTDHGSMGEGLLKAG
jgi:biotin operon repressor